jgi:hypothetical protein
MNRLKRLCIEIRLPVVFGLGVVTSRVPWPWGFAAGGCLMGVWIYLTMRWMWKSR